MQPDEIFRRVASPEITRSVLGGTPRWKVKRYFATTGSELAAASFPDLPIATAERKRMMENSHASNCGGSLLVNAQGA